MLTQRRRRKRFYSIRKVLKTDELNFLGKCVYLAYFIVGRRGIALLLLLSIVGSSIYFDYQTSLAATYTWSQATWSGGLDGGTYPNHTSNQSNWTKYSAKDAATLAVNAGADLQIASSTTTNIMTDDGTTSTGFNLTGKVFSSTETTGTAAATSIQLTSSISNVGTWTTLTSSPVNISMGSSLHKYNNELYVLSGGNGTTFYKFTIADNTWTALATIPTTNFLGSRSFIDITTGKIYLRAGASLLVYTISSNTWTWLADAVNSLQSNPTDVLLHVDGEDYIYESNDQMYKYQISTNVWTLLTPPTDGWIKAYGNGIRGPGENYIYRPTIGNLARYSISGNSWSNMSPVSLGKSGRMIRNGTDDTIYMLLGGDTQSLKKYSIASNTWTPLTNVPEIFPAPGGNDMYGSIMFRDGSADEIYASPGNSSTGFYRYSITGNSWTTLTSLPTGLGAGSQIEVVSDSNGTRLYILQGDTSPGFGGKAFYRFNATSRVYASSGTYTSGVIDAGKSVANWGTLSWTKTGAQTVSIKARSSNSSSMAGATAYASCSNITSGAALSTGSCVTNGHRYVQYQATLSTSDTAVTPTLNDVTITYSTYATSTTLTSSSYNTSSSANLLSGISWSQATTSSSSIKFQIRTAPDNAGVPGTWSNFIGPTGATTTYYTNLNGTEAAPAAQTDGVNDQWVQYKAYLISDGASTPTLNSATLTYVVNASPGFDPNYPTTGAGGVGAVQNSDGTITINYSIRDPDTDTGTTMPGYLRPSFYYSLDGGSSYTLISTTSTMQASSYSDKAVSTTTYRTFTATSTIINQLTGQYAANAKIKVIVDDREAANNTASSTSAAFVLDTKTPSLGALPISIDASQSPALITLSATDDTALVMKVGKTADLSDVPNYYAYANSTTTSSVISGDTIYAVFKDAKNNSSSIVSVTPPIPTASNFFQDISNPNTLEWREFYAWAVSPVPPQGFRRYNVYRSVNGGGFSLLTTITNRMLNYIVDSGLSESSTYSYKVSIEDNDGNISLFSPASTADRPDGTGGSDIALPSLSTVTIGTTTTSGAYISWITNKYANSIIYYVASTTYPGTDKSAYSASVGVPSMLTSHTVILDRLIPDTQYYFLVESQDASNNSGQSSSASYTFRTEIGPRISNVTTAEIFDTEAAITWNTSTNADSSVWYSSSTDMSNSVEIIGSGSRSTNHRIKLTNLVKGTRYYYYVKSVDADGNVATDMNVVNGTINYYTLNTSEDTSKPIISGVETALISDSDATITWTTDKQSNSQVEWGIMKDPTASTSKTTGLSTDHYVTLSNLQKNTQYFYRVLSEDKSGNVGIGDNTGEMYTFTTNGILFDNVATSSITTTGATITWNTNTVSDSTVFYEAVTSYPGTNKTNYTKSVGVSNMTTSHSVVLSNLTPGTQYYFLVTSEDSQAQINQQAAETYTFITNPGPSISQILTSDTQDTEATVTWHTNLASDSSVYYSTNSNLTSPEVVTSVATTTSHSITLTGLVKGTNYYYYVKSIDEEGNVATDKNVVDGVINYYVVNTTRDIVPPVISDVKTPIIGESSATITWTTDEQSNSQVEWGIAKDLGIRENEPDMFKTQHSMSITGLVSSTTYYFVVRSRDRSENIAIDDRAGEKYSFTTLAPTVVYVTKTEYVGGGGGGALDNRDLTVPVISNVVVDSIGGNSATISFKSSKIATGKVKYGKTTSYGSETKRTGVYGLTHQISLNNLTPLTTYHFKAYVTDIYDNVGEGVDTTFTTLANGVVSQDIPIDVDTSSMTAEETSAYNKALSASASIIKAMLFGLIKNSNLSNISESQLASSLSALASKAVASPVISGTDIQVESSANTATIRWVTDKASNSLVGYSKASDYKNDSSYSISAGFPDEKTSDHEVILQNLAPSTTYHYQVRSQSLVGTASLSSDRTFTTTSLVPDISNIKFEKILESEATLTWKTDLPTKSQIEIKDNSTGKITKVDDPSFVKEHTYTANNLNYSTGYTFTVNAIDNDGNTSNPSIIPFSTTVSTEAPKISNVRITSSIIPDRIETTQSIISWKSDKPATSRVLFAQGTSDNLDQSTPTETNLVRDHIIVTTLLKPGTIYKIVVESGDAAGNATKSEPYTVLTQKPKGSVVDLIFKNLDTTFGFMKGE